MLREFKKINLSIFVLGSLAVAAFAVSLYVGVIMIAAFMGVL